MDVKEKVREFYNQVGWQESGEGQYQNARYEDLRPVSSLYIHRCHLRVARHLRSSGRLLLDAGSGPVQYPEYLEYSRQYRHRVCVDISIVALQEARRRLGEHGLYVVADIANLPFAPGAFDGVVSLHTIHHLPLSEHARAYTELFRMLAPGARAVVVNGWDHPTLTVLTDFCAGIVDGFLSLKRRLFARPEKKTQAGARPSPAAASPAPETGTFVRKHNAGWVRQEIGALMPVEIWVWRSVNTRFLRTFIHSRTGGQVFLRLLFWLEERFPHFFGANGQYPLIVLYKQDPTPQKG